ncbi:hypothetical protein ACWY4P_18890 [Streptomyces sp. LZ34]
MEKRAQSTGVFACVVAVVGGAVGFGTWLRGSRPGIRGSFEGERDFSLLYVELPLMMFGVPLLTYAVWALARTTLRHRMGRTAWTAASGVVVAATLAGLAWGCSEWLAVRVQDFVYTGL